MEQGGLVGNPDKRTLLQPSASRLPPQTLTLNVSLHAIFLILSPFPLLLSISPKEKAIAHSLIGISQTACNECFSGDFVSDGTRRASCTQHYPYSGHIYKTAYCNQNGLGEFSNASITSKNIFYFLKIAFYVLATLLSSIASTCKIAAPSRHMMTFKRRWPFVQRRPLSSCIMCTASQQWQPCRKTRKIRTSRPFDHNSH